MMADSTEYFKFPWIIARRFNTKHAAFIVHLDTVGLQLELYPAADGTVFIIGDCLSLKPRVRFAPQKGKDIGACEIVECVTNQRWINTVSASTFPKAARYMPGLYDPISAYISLPQKAQCILTIAQFLSLR